MESKLPTPLPPAPVPDIHPAVAAALDRGARPRIARLAALVTAGERRGIAILATCVDTTAQMEAAASRLGSVLLRNASRPAGAPLEAVALVTGFQVIDNASRLPLGGENDGPAGAATLARALRAAGTPVSLVTDTGSRRTVEESLVAAGLRHGSRLHVADATVETRAHYTARLRRRMEGDGVTTLVCIERPGPNREGVLCNMAGHDVSAHNADLSGLLVRDGAWHPYTVGIGDGGNELGLGGLHDAVAGMRHPDGRPVVPNGARIAARPDAAADAVVLGAVSNTAALALCMAVRAVTGDGGFASDIATHDAVIHHLVRLGLSIDGVRQLSLPSIDGRALGTAADSAAHPGRAPGHDDATHHDTFRDMLAVMAPAVTDARAAP